MKKFHEKYDLLITPTLNFTGWNHYEEPPIVNGKPFDLWGLNTACFNLTY